MNFLPAYDRADNFGPRLSIPASEIFPAEIVRESAREELPARAHGAGLAPGDLYPSIGPQPVERERIRLDLRPAGWAADTVVILGAGAVTLRTGVDLFIACARKVAEMAPKREFRFVWIAEGLDAETDAKYTLCTLRIRFSAPN